MGKFGQDAGVTPLLFSKDILGFFMTTKSQDLSLTSHPKDGAFYSIVSLSQTAGWAPPTGLTNTSSSSNLGTDQAQPCLASVGNRSWAAGWYGCWQAMIIIIIIIII